MIMDRIKYILYRYKFLLFYILIGFSSIILEIIVMRAMISYDIPNSFSSVIGFVVGLIIAFTLNVRFNFHIAYSKLKKALLYFSIISSISFIVQMLLREKILSYGYSFDFSRISISGLFFIFSYFLHRRFSFREYKKVGVAIYADGVEDINFIYNKISNISDFIHIDIVDKSFNPNSKEVKAYRAEVVRAYWQKKIIEVHIMSRKPSNWLSELFPYVDIIYIHPSLDEDLAEVLKSIKSNGCSPGIAIGVNESMEAIHPHIDNGLVKNILILAIPQPGFSGQQFDLRALPMIEILNKLSNRSDFQICVDGGINDTTVKYLNVDSVVSGSYILGSNNPIKNIIHLQNSGEYAKY